MSEPRAYTPAECREMLLDYWRTLAKYWADEAKRGHDHPFEGFLHSILVTIDGESVLPAFRLIADPHPDDEAFSRSEGENWWPMGADITENVYLHEMLYAPVGLVPPADPSVGRPADGPPKGT